MAAHAGQLRRTHGSSAHADFGVPSVEDYLQDAFGEDGSVGTLAVNSYSVLEALKAEEDEGHLKCVCVREVKWATD